MVVQIIDQKILDEHYKKCWPIIKSFFIDKDNDSWRAAVPSHKGWWDIDGDKAKLFYPDDETFFEKILPILLKSDNPALYWTTQFFTPSTKDIIKPYTKGEGIKEQIGGRETTVQMSFLVDIDRAKGTDIHDKEVVKYLQEAIRFFATYFIERGVTSFGTAFSGGGCYAQFHPRLGLMDEIESVEKFVWAVKVYQKAFDILIGDIAAQFYEKYPDAVNYVKFDKLNFDSKRQVKTVLAVHKSLPYAVVPFEDKLNPIIDFERCRLPLTDEVIDSAKDWLKYNDDIDAFGPIMQPYLKQAQKFMEETTSVTTRHVKIEGDPIKPKSWAPCIKEIIKRKNLKSGAGASRALALIAAYMRFTGYPPDLAYKLFTHKAKQWNAETSNIFESFYNSKTCYVPNCEKIRAIGGSGFPHLEMGELDICKPNKRCAKCLSPIRYHLVASDTIPNGNKEEEKQPTEELSEAMKLLQDKELLVRINNSFDTKIVHDKKVRNVVFLTGVSAYTKNPLNLFLEGPSSSGKTYVVVETMKYLPTEDVWFIGNLSPTALAHDYGRMEVVDGEPRKIISLWDKILVFLERPNLKTLEMLKPILSHDVERIQYRTTEKTKEGQNRTFKTEIEGWPAFIFCTTETTLLKEISTRNLLYAPEVSKEKVEDALKLQRDSACYPWKHAGKENGFVDTVREALTLLKSRNNGSQVAIPDISALDCEINTTDTRVMRDNKKRLELVKTCAWLHSENRYRFEHNNGGSTNDYIMAGFHDIFVGLCLYDEVKLSTETGLAPVVIDFFRKVIKPMCEEDEVAVSYKDMAHQHYEVYKQLIGEDTLRLHRVKPLVQAGYMIEVDDPNDKRKKSFSVVRDIKTQETTDKLRQIYFNSGNAENELKEWLLEVEKITTVKIHVINQLIEERGIEEISRACAHARNTLLNSYYFLGVNPDLKIESDEKKSDKNNLTRNVGNFGKKTKNVCDRCGVDTITTMYRGEHLCPDCLDIAKEQDKVEEIDDDSWFGSAS